MDKIVAVIFAAFGVFLILSTVLVVRALRFKPGLYEAASAEPIFVNGEKAAETLREMIRCKTVSCANAADEDKAEFDKFKAILPKIFPLVFEKCQSIEIGEKSILIKWSGKSNLAPTVLMSHYDVVSAVEEKWEKPAFEGLIESGVLWGRGTLDTKCTLNGILFAAQTLISEGFIPENDIYMAFGGDEEVSGHGAVDIVSYFKENGITPGMVLDEGGAVVENVFPGVKSPCALIGIAEKGMINVEYSVSGAGGHASSPPPNTPVGTLSLACVRMESKNPFKFRITEPARKMFDTLARHSSFGYRLIFANLWFFSPVLNLLTRKSGGELNALVRTTVAFTQMECSKGMNVIPPTATMLSNHRIIPGETTESVISQIKKTVNDDSVEIRMVNGMNPSRISRTDTDAWKNLCSVISVTWQDAIVSPYLMLACSDSRHWGDISDKVYRFSAMALSKEERGYIHGNNERIPLSTISKTVEFYIRLMKRS